MVDANVRLAGRLLAGALAIVALIVLVPWLFHQRPATSVRPSAIPAALDTTQPTILHAVEGFDGTPSPLSGGDVTPASLNRAVEGEETSSATLPAPLASDDLRR